MATTYEPIATTTLASAAANITFSSIPATYTDLRVVFVCALGGGQAAYGRFNGDTATNYSDTDMAGIGTTANSGRNTSTAWIRFFNWQSGSTIPSLVTWDIFSYAGSTYKTSLVVTANDQNGTGTVERAVGLWRSTAAITSVTIVGSTNLPIGTTATLYGIKAA